MLPGRMPDGAPWPRISIITPSFNQAPYLEECLRSVLLQRYPNLEYIVVDGGSADGSVDVIRQYAPFLAHWVSEPDRGQAHAINKGLARATGEFVAWLNSDDYYLAGAFQRITRLFDRHRDYGVIYGDCLYRRDIDNSTEVRGARPFRWPTVLRGENPVWQPSAFMRRDVVERAGGLDESLHLALDFDLWLRAAKQTQFLQVAGEPLSVAHDHPEAKSRRQWSQFVFESRRSVERFFAEEPIPPEAVPLRRSVLAHLDFECAAATVFGGGGLRAIPWLLRALTGDPRLVGRGVRVVARRLRGRRARALVEPA